MEANAHHLEAIKVSAEGPRKNRQHQRASPKSERIQRNPIQADGRSRIRIDKFALIYVPKHLADTISARGLAYHLLRVLILGRS